MSNNLENIKRSVKYLAKRYKGISYSTSLVLLFAMLGVNAFSEDVIEEVAVANGTNIIEKTQIRTSADRLSEILSQIKEENEKKLKGANLELVQLMEQGDQVVKSPWASWQFGINYFYSDHTGKYKGRRDKSGKYLYEGILNRSTDVYERYTSVQSSKYFHLSTKKNIKSASTTNRKGLKKGYGLVNIQELQEKSLKFEVSAAIRPKSVTKGVITLGEKTPQIPKLPEVAKFSFNPITVDTITVTSSNPTVSVTTISKTAPTAPTVSANTPTTPVTTKFEIPNPSIGSVSVKVQPVTVKAKEVTKREVNVTPNTATAPQVPKTINFNPIKPVVNIPASPATPVPPTFAVILGADCNNACSGNEQNTKNNFLTSVYNKSQQNIPIRVRYTWPYNKGAEKRFAFKMDLEETLDWGNRPDEIFFNSYNFGYKNLDEGEYGNNVDSSQGDDRNHQYFFIGGSRFIEFDNKDTGSYEIPSQKIINLGGILSLGFVVQDNGITAINSGTITDKKEKNDKWIQEMKYTAGKDYLEIKGPNYNANKHEETVYKIRKSTDGYVGYKIGMAQVEEDGDKGNKFYNRGTIDFRGERSIGMYSYLPTHTSKIKLVNEKEILISGKESYGMRLSSHTDSNAEMINDDNAVITLRKNPEGQDKANNSAAMALMEDSTVKDNVSLEKGKAVNKGKINLTDVENSLGMFVNIDSDMTNRGTINIDSTIADKTTEQPINTAMRADYGTGKGGSTTVSSNAKIINIGAITLNGSHAIGQLVRMASAENTGKITTTTSIDDAVGILNLGGSIKNTGSIILTGRKNNIGVFLNKYTTTDLVSKIRKADGELGTGSNITVKGDNSTGILLSGESTLKYTGDVTVQGNSVSGVVVNDKARVEQGTIASGKITVNNDTTAAGITRSNNGAKGSYGVVVTAGSTLNLPDINADINVTGAESIGIYSAGEVVLKDVNVKTDAGAVNFYAGYNSGSSTKGTITINSTANGSQDTVTGEKSLLFYIEGTGANSGQVILRGPMKATIKGSTDSANRGTAFLYTGATEIGTYTTFDTVARKAWITNAFGGTLNNLTLDMEAGSRLFSASGIEMALSETTATNLFAGLQGPKFTPASTDYVPFMLYRSKLNVNKSIDLDDSTDVYNKLEISNSSITNKATNIIKGTKDKQVAIAQKNESEYTVPTNRGYVSLINEGTIVLDGNSSAGIYGSFSNLKNTMTGTITLNGDASTGMYGVKDSRLSNEGTITLNGDASTGMYHSDFYKESASSTVETTVNTTGGMENSGTIVLNKNKSIGMAYVPGFISENIEVKNNRTISIAAGTEKNVGMYGLLSKNTTVTPYTLKNTGTITIGNSTSQNNANLGMYAEGNSSFTGSSAGVDIQNSGTITVGENSIGLYGYKIENTAGQIDVSKNGIGIYSQGKNVDLTGGTITTADSVSGSEAVGVYLKGEGQTLTNSGTTFTLGENTFGIINANTGTIGNTINSTIPNVSLTKNNSTYIYSTDKKGKVENSSKLTGGAVAGISGIYSAGTVTNSKEIDFSSSTGSVAIQSTEAGTATNKAKITVGKSVTTTGSEVYSIGMLAGISGTTTTTGNVVNDTTGVIDINNDNSLGMYGTAKESTGINKGTINVGAAGKNIVGMYADKDSVMTNEKDIKLASSITAAGATQAYNFGMISSNGTGTGSVKNASNATITLSGPYTIGMMSDKSKIENSGKITGTSATNSIGIVGISGSNVTNSGEVKLDGENNTGLFLSGAETTGTTTGTSNIKLTGNDSIGIFVDNKANLSSYEGTTELTGSGVYGIAFNNGGKLASNGGKLKVGTSATPSGETGSGTTTKGSMAIATMDNSSEVTGSMDVDAYLTGKNSIGAYSKGKIELKSANITTSNGAVNFYADGGTIKVGNGGGTSATVTGIGSAGSQGSLLFYTKNNGKIEIANTMNSTIKGDSNPALRGTAFLYNGTTLGGTNTVSSWLGNSFKGLNKLKLTMEDASRLVLVEGTGHNVKLSELKVSALGIGQINDNTNYKSFTMSKSMLNIDEDTSLDGNTDYTRLELLNSSITNNNTITGTQANQYAMAQETDTTATGASQNDVILKNEGDINLSGANSIGMYTKFGTLKNASNGKMNVSGAGSTAMFGLNNSKLTNDGVVNISNKSTGIYYSDVTTATTYATKESLKNAGIINISAGNESVGMVYEPGNIGTNTVTLENNGTIQMTSTGDKNVGMFAKAAKDNKTYDVKNTGTIKMADATSTTNANVGIYTENNNKIVNSGDITIGKNSIGAFGYGVANSGDITVGENGMGIFSKGDNVDLTAGTITTADSAGVAQAAVGVYLYGRGQTLTNSRTKFDLGKNTFGIINSGFGNTIDSTISSIVLAKDGATYIYSTDANGTVNNSSKLIASARKNMGIYSAGTVNNNGDMDFNAATGSIGIQSISNGTATNNVAITVGKSDKTNSLYSIGMSAGISGNSATKGKIVNSATGTIKVNHDNSLGMYSTEAGSTGENLGTIETSTSGTTAMFANNSSVMTNKNKININSTTATETSYNFGMTSSGATNSEVINDASGVITLAGKYGIGMYSNGSKATNSGKITATSANNMIAMHSAASSAGLASTLQNEGNINLVGSDNVGISLTGSGTTGTTTSSSKVTLTGDNSTGISVAKGSKLTDAGTTTVKGNGVYGIVLDDNVDSTMISTGKLIVSGVSGSAMESSTRGSVGIAVMNTNAAAGLTGSLDTDINVSGGKSVGLYSKGNLVVDEADVKTYNGATNFFADGGNITVGNAGGVSNVITGTGDKGSLLFYATGAGKININGTMNATIEGGANAAKRGTAFYYNGGSGVPFATWLSNTFSGLNNLHLTMNSGSRLIAAQRLTVNLSNTGLSAIFPTGVIGSITGTDYKTFMLHRSNLTIDQAVNLDNTNDAYNNLEIAGSSITNNNTITGTQDAQTAMVQETDGSNVVLINNGTINLSGKESTAMYTKKSDVSTGTLTNNGTINIGDKSTAMYGVNNVVFSNTSTGTINIGSDSTAMYYTDKEGSTVYNTTTGLSNAGTIISSGNNSIAMSYQAGNIKGTPIFENKANITMPGDKNIGMYALKANSGSYTTKNSGTITMGDSAELTNSNVGIYTNSTTVGTNPIENTGTIAVGKNAIGIYGNEVTQSSGNIITGDNGVGIYSKRGDINLTGGTIKVAQKEAVGVFTSGTETRTIKNSGTLFEIGDTSFGFVNIGNAGNTIESTTANITLSGNDSVYVYSNDSTSTIKNSSKITSTGTIGGNYGIISSGTITNSGEIDFTQGIGNVGIYSNGSGLATNSATIKVGASDPDTQRYSIGMAAGYKNDKDTVNQPTTGNIKNTGSIYVEGKNGIGMYGTNGSIVETTVGSKIVLNADNTTGIYLDEGARGINRGDIKTGKSGLSNVVGVYLGKGAVLENHGNIEITATNGAGVYLKGGTVRNYGVIKAYGSGAKDIYTYGNDLSKPGFGGVEIEAKPGATKATIKVNGKEVTPKVVVTNITESPKTISASSIGLYVDTSGTSYTKPIEGLGKLTKEADLIIGTEASKITNSKYIEISDPKILESYNNAITSGQVKKWNIYSGGLTWTATAILNPITSKVNKLYLAKASYTGWAGDKDTTRDTYNFADGLEQRYGVDALGTRENKVFEKLNSIGNNEETLLYQAFDEMMGHQYGNLQQRIQATGSILDKEFKYLKREWRTESKDSNKIKVFGMNGEYSTDTAGIIDYKSNAYGVAYVGENETFRLGNTTGWYTGIVHNTNKFKDIGRSKEEMLQAKLGIFKSEAFDENNSLNWTISGEGFVGYNKMDRKYLVVDEIFGARSKYWTYGVAIKNELNKDFRLTENFNFTVYGSMKAEYGRFEKIQEKNGQVRLEIKANDYYSIKPEVGAEIGYKQPMGLSMFNTRVGLAYENELGKVADAKNKARVAHTNADWFNVRGEKEDRRGNIKLDFNVGYDNSRYGITANVGYDTKGNNIRGGLGLRVIF